MSGQMLRVCSTVGVLFIPLAVLCQTPAPPKPVENLKVVSTDPSHLRVEVTEPSTLTKVFKAVCTEQKLDCTGADSLGSYPVPKMEVDGTLREVVDNLLEGTGVNYRYTRATTSVNAKLELLGHAPQGNNTALPDRGNRENVPPPPLHSMPFPGRGPGATVSPPADSNQSQPPQQK